MLIRTIHEPRRRGGCRRRRAAGGYSFYLCMPLSGGSEPGPSAPGRLALPRSLAVAIGEHVRALPPETRAILEMLAVLDFRLPLAQLGQAAQAGWPSAAIEPAVACGLVNWWPDEPTCPVEICHATVREAIYASITVTRRRTLHARAAYTVSQAASWQHRVAALEHPDEGLAGELERLAREEAADGRLVLAATHLRWASDISPARADLERRLLTAALHLMLAGESRGGLALLPAVRAAAPCPLRSCVLAMNALSSGQVAEAERMFSEALARAREDPDGQPLAAVIAARLAGTGVIPGSGQKVQAFARWALGTGRLDAAAASQARTLVAIGVSQVAGPREALTALGHLQSDPDRIGPADVDGLTIRGWFRLLVGDLGPAVRDLTACLKMARHGATLSLGLRAYFYLALAQYLAGAWDDALFTAEQGFSAVIHSRRHELPLLHLAAACVPAGRGAAGEAERHAALAEEAAASLDYGKENLYAAMARALVCQAAGDYLGMADALGPWRDEAALDGRPRLYAVLWRPLLAEGLIGSGQLEPAADVVARLRADSGQVGYLRPALAWLDGWLAEQRGDPDQARRIYQRGEGIVGTGSPVYTAQLLLAHGRLLRRTGNRKDAAERLRRANALFAVLRATPFLARTEEELAACHLPVNRAEKQPVLALTSRETEVARLVGQGLSNPEIAAELYISRKAVEYHLGNIYAKCGLQGRQQLRRFVEQWHQPTTV